MTIDEIKQAMREMKEHCKNRKTCEDCPFAISQGRYKVCPTFGHIGDIPYPSKWDLNWPEDAPIAKPDAANPLTLSDYQRMARRTASATRTSDKMEDGEHGIFVDVGEPCNHEKKYMNKCREIDYDRMTDAAYAAIMAIKLATHVLGCSIEDISKMDLDKYRPRYHGGFDPERSINREGENEDHH